MAKILVVTNFSDSADNALRYACAFVAGSSTASLLLVNIDAVPASYSGDGVSLAAISDTLGSNIDKLKKATDACQKDFPGIDIKYRALVGGYIKTLKELIEEEEAKLMVLGTPAAYGEIFTWDTDTLSAMTELPIPVLAVPRDVSFKPIKHISFASIPGNLHSASPINSIKKLVSYTGAQLHVVSVMAPDEQTKDQEAAVALQEQLQEVNPVYHQVYGPHIVQAIGQFVEDQQIDLLLVRPRKHGIWYNLFHKSYTRELARLNLIPVMALHDEWLVD